MADVFMLRSIKQDHYCFQLQQKLSEMFKFRLVFFLIGLSKQSLFYSYLVYILLEQLQHFK